MEKQEILNKIEEFIILNELQFNDFDSGLNSTCVIICGYTLFIDEKEQVEDYDLLKLIERVRPDFSSSLTEELNRVWQFACDNDYGSWWNNPKNRKQYKC